MADCRGEPCKVTKYQFSWADVVFTDVTAHSRPVGEPPHSTDTKVRPPDGEDSKERRKAFRDGVLKGVGIKADNQKDEEKRGRHLRKRIEVNKDSVTLVDATCGPGGDCYCDEEGPETAGAPIEITVSISDLMGGLEHFGADYTYDVDIVVKATPKTSPGLCFGTKQAF
jgi:hypothetical protein